MGVPGNSSFSNIPARFNQGIDNLQKRFGWQPEYDKGNPNAMLQRQIDEIKRQIVDINKKSEAQNRRIQILEFKFDSEKQVNAAEHKALWGAIGAIQKLVTGLLAGLPALVQTIILSVIGSVLLSKLLELGMGLFLKNGKFDLSGILARIQEAKDDARAAATLAVKAEGKADKASTKADSALEYIKFIEKSALDAFKRLEAFIKSEIAFLTNATNNALLRLQDRIINLEALVKSIKSQLDQFIAAINSQIKSINTLIQKQFLDLNKTIKKLSFDLNKSLEKLAIDFNKSLEGIKTDLAVSLNKLKSDFTGEINKIKSNVLQELQKIKPLIDKIPEILAQIATFGIQVAAIFLAINAINAVIAGLKLAVGKGVTIINNYTNNNYTNVTNVNNPPLDLGLLKKIDITTSTNLSLTASVQSAVQVSYLKLLSGFKWLQLDRLLNLLIFAGTVHNALQLSSNISTTLMQVIQNALDTIGLKDDSGAAFDVTSAINSTVENTIKAIVGEDNYTNIKKEWAKYNRIYQAAGNLFSSLLDMADTTLYALQVISGQTSKIGNALRNAGEVFENAYGWFNPTPNFSNPLLTKLNSLEETASMVENVSQQPLNVKSAKEDLEESAKNLADSWEQNEGAAQGKEVPEAKQEKEKRTADKDESKGLDIEDPIDKLEADD
ncbi:hypothetical protein [Anabaena sp. PCC 7108]|uniref:hypothetical protein n=1 Tax=Anabaena sp. PCC 7108 TaxID=163908 RepID=UPI00034977A9|nr:hypothetical protein [Anabaena sp. PCC 7108]